MNPMSTAGPATFTKVDARTFRYRQVLSAQERAAIVERSRAHAVPYDHPEPNPVDSLGRHLVRGQLIAHPVNDAVKRLGQDVIDRLWTVFAHANTALSGWNIPFDVMRLSVSRYDMRDWMGAHVDDERRNPPPWDLAHRGISMSVPLTGGHSGGRLRLRTESGDWGGVELEPGDAVLFGSSLEHEVVPVTYGSRWVLLAWAYNNHRLSGAR